jgi:Zn-dependent M16 (insulinase) family peptidase
LINITGENQEVPSIIEKIFSHLSPPRGRNELLYEKDFFDRAVSSQDLIRSADAVEIFSSETLQIGFAALSLGASAFGTKEASAETVLAHYLSTGALWTVLRMKGGAYGAHAAANSIEGTFTFSTYRDPRPADSVLSFSKILEAAQKTKIKDDMLEKIIIGAYAKEKQPAANPVKGFKDFMRFLYNISDEMRTENLENIITAGADDITDAALRLCRSISKTSPRVILAGKTESSRAAAKFKAAVCKLPC